MENNTESVNISKVTINTPTRVLDCGDGVIEQIEDEDVEVGTEVKAEPNIVPKTAWCPWLSHYTQKSWSYAGEAVIAVTHFFEEFNRKIELQIAKVERELQIMKSGIDDEEPPGWVPKDGGGDVPLILNEPLKSAGGNLFHV